MTILGVLWILAFAVMAVVTIAINEAVGEEDSNLLHLCGAGLAALTIAMGLLWPVVSR